MNKIICNDEFQYPCQPNRIFLHVKIFLLCVDRLIFLPFFQLYFQIKLKQKMNSEERHIPDEKDIEKPESISITTEEIVPPDGGRGWLVVLGSFMVN